MTIVWAIGFGVVTAVHLVACARGPERVRVVTKPLLMLTLLGLYLTGASPVAWPLVAALVLALVGDVLLVRTTDPWLVLGGIAFLLCHAGYLWTFLADVRPAGLPGWVWACLVPYAAIAVAQAARIRARLGAKTVPTLAYLAVLSLVGFAALARWACLGTWPAALTWLGTVVFLVSDYALLSDQFRRPLRQGNLVVMATYALAQLFIVGGLVLA